MVPKRATQAYSQVAVETADQKTLILICYDEAIRSLEIGKECYFRNEFEKKAREFNRAQGLISELLTALNFEAGGQIAQNLSAIYKFMLNQITVADLRRDLTSLDKVIWMLKELKSAWASIEQKPSMTNIPVATSSQPARLQKIAV